MEAIGGEYFQTAVTGTPPNTAIRRERIDIVVGSGRRGQTYLWWKGNRLFSMPVRFWTPSNEWVSAGGFADGIAPFDVPPPVSCLDCHITSLTAVGNGYDPDSLMLGLSCEKCHGPGSDHVKARRAGTPVPAGQDVVNPAILSRDRRLDLCALCHSDAGAKIEPHFSYVVGQPLVDYLPPASRGLTSGGAPTSTLDVHGRQVDLLRMSRCFKASPEMTCETCHDVHQTQRDIVGMSARCLTCHKAEACGRYADQGNAISGKCVECHMPQQPSALGTTTSAGFRAAMLRTHLIKVYDDSARSGTVR